MSFFSDIEQWFGDLFSRRIVITPAVVAGQVQTAVAGLEAVAAVVEESGGVPASIRPAVDKALEDANTAAAALSADPQIEDFSGVLHSLSTVVASFPPGPNHDKAAAIVSTVTAAYVTLHNLVHPATAS